MPDPQSGFKALHQAVAARVGKDDPILNDLESVAAFAMDAGVTLCGKMLFDLLWAELFRYSDLEGQQRAAPRQLIEELGGDGFRRILSHFTTAAAAIKPGAPREEQFEVIGQLRHGPHGGAGGPHRIGLVDGNRRRDAVDAVDLGLVHAVKKLPCIGGEGLHITSLAFGVNGVEGQRRFA